MTDSTDAPLDKIRALLAMAERGATQEERDAFNGKAAALLAKYGVDRAMLAATDPNKPEVVGDRVVRVEAPFAIEKMELLGGIAYELGCRAVYLKRAAHREVHLFGFPSDMERVEIMFTSLLLQSATELLKLDVPQWESAPAFKRSFLSGFTDAVRWRLRQAEDAARARKEAERTAAGASGPSVSLVLVGRKDKVAKVLEERYPNTKVLKRKLAGNGRGEGERAGMRANLSTSANLGAKGRTELPGQA